MFIRDAAYFLLGSVIGVVMHAIFLKIFSMHQQKTNEQILLVGILQILLITYIIHVWKTPPPGIFNLGLIVSQELFLTRLYPRNRKTHI